MSETVIGITTWGSPWHVYPDNYRWRDVEYVYADDTMCRVSSRTTLSLISRCVSSLFRRFIVIVPSTVVFDPGLSSYDKLIQHIEEIYRRFIEEEIKKTENLSIENLDLIIAPSAGKFSNRYRRDYSENELRLDYCGSISNFYHYVYSELSRILAKEILDILEKQDPEKSLLKIILDLSHGINYMPVLTYRAVKDLVGTASAFLGNNVALKVLNSEPVDVSRRDMNKTTIHVVEEIRSPRPEPFSIKKSERLLRLEGRCLRRDLEDAREIREKLEEEENKILELAGVKNIDEIAIFASSIENGYPLLTLATIPQNIDLESIIVKLREVFHRFTRLSKRGDSEIEVRYLARYTINTSNLIKSLMIAEIIEKGLEIHRRSEASLREIKRITECLWGLYRDKRIKIAREIYSIKNMIIRGKDVYCDGSYRKLYEAIDQETSEETCRYIEKEEDRFERNLIAHAGFERCVTEFKCLEDDEDKIYLRYSEQHLNRVKEIVLKQVQET